MIDDVFVKYQLVITKTVERPKVVQEYKEIASSGNERDGKAIYGYVNKNTVERESFEVLKMESTDANINLTEVVKAMLGI